MTDIQTSSSHERDTTAFDLRLDNSIVMPTLPPVKINVKTIGGILYNTIRWRGSGCFKINTTSDDLKKLNITSRSSTAEPLQAFPTILELAQLSQHAYKISDLQDETEVPFEIDKMSDWICIGTGRYSDGYCGAGYVNHKYSHVVIAHGGTDPRYIRKPLEFYRDIITDIGGVVLNKEVSQISSAYIFTKLIVNLCSDTQFSISVTGHSLGGWLAQISAFYIAHPQYISQNKEVKKIIEDKQKNLGIPGQYVEIKEPYHLHTVSFDSPGCRKALKSIVGYHGSKMVEWRENVDALDFTVIIAPSNAVNTCGEHIGYVLTLEMPGVQDISWGSASHDKQYFVDYLSSDVPKLKEVHDVYYRKAVKSEVESIILYRWYLGREDSCQVNIFSPKELEILTRIQIIFKWRNNESLKSSWSLIFGEEKHNGARELLESIEQELLTDFIQHFNVTHNVIEFPKKCLEANKLDMSELIWKLIRWLRVKRVWLSGTVFHDVIRDLPGCREMFCESQGSLYIDKIPKLHGRKCTTQKLCDKVRAFLGNAQNVLQINAGNDGRQSRVYMVHLFNCFGRNSEYYIGEHILFMNSSIVHSLHQETEVTNIFSHTKFRLIVVECDSEINEKMDEVIKGMIENVKSEKKKLIIVTSGQNCPALKTYSPLECDSKPTLLFDNLDVSSKGVISQCLVDIHGQTVMLGKYDPPCGQYLLEDVGSFFNPDNSSKIICDIFDGKILHLSCGSLPTMADHYIPRTLYQITLDVEQLKEKGKDFPDIIVASDCDGSTRRLSPDLISLLGKSLIHVRDREYRKKDFMNDCSAEFKSRNVHWFQVEEVDEESVLVWQMSNGQPCLDYLVNDKGGIPDSKLHELKNNFSILADEPGMGKSAAITKLFLEYRNTQLNLINSHFNWPVYINLNAHQVELKNKTYSSDSVLPFLAKAMNLDSDFEKSLFEFCLKKIGNVTFFIDSFDEISLKGQDFVVQMLQGLKALSHSKIYVWIATRHYAKYGLEEMLGTKSYKFHRIEKNDQTRFLANYWTTGVPGHFKKTNIHIKNFAEKFATLAIEEIRKVLGTDHTFIGIPLQLVLLALIYNDKFLELLEHKLGQGVEGTPLSLSIEDWKNYSDKFSSTLELYDLFVEKKLNIWLGDKSNLDTRTDWQEGILKSRMNEIHSQAAFLYVSSSILTPLDVNLEPEALSPVDSNEMNRAGFCEISDVSESNFRFYHQTIAEYYTAKYLVNLITRKESKNKVILFLKSHYYKPYFKKIRYFLDSLLCTDIPVLKNLELLDIGSDDQIIRSDLLQCLRLEDWQNCVDALGRNLLHYAMAYGDHGSGIFWIIGKGFSLFHKKDLLGETCLSYLCLSEGFLSRINPILEKYRDYRREILAHKNLGKIDKKFPRHIIGVQILYSIFCGSNFEVQFIESDLHAMELNKSSGVALNGLIVPFNFIASINRVMFLHFIKNTDVDQLTKNVEINMTWLSHYRENILDEMTAFLSRLCLHNSLDEESENNFLNEWFETCLSEKADECRLELGMKLNQGCKGIDKFEGCVLQILRSNLPHYYHNAFPYMAAWDEYALWTSCTDIKGKEKMLLVMKNHNFYSLTRAMFSNSPLVKEVTDFVYNESGGEFRDAMNEGLAKAFHIFIFYNTISFAFDIYEVSDEEAKEQMIMRNFEFQPNNVVQDKQELSFKSEQTILDIIEGKNNLWALRSFPIITTRDLPDLPRQFFTLPVLCDYPK